MFAPVAVCCLVLAPTSVAAQSIWERAKQGPLDEEREVQAAIERVLLGYGDERDLLRVRVALITLSRGEVSDPRSIVWLVRLRREMGLMPAVVSERLLREALRSRLSATERGWAYLELSHLALRERNLDVALARLNDALAHCWQSAHRAEALVLRGFVRLRQSDEDTAILDFAAARALSAPRRVAVEAHLGLALSHAARGDGLRLAQEARSAYLVEASRATVSRLDPFWDLALGPLEQQAARAVLLWGKAEALSGTNAEAAELSRRNACLLVRRSPQAIEKSRLEGPALEEGPVWGARAVAALLGLFGDACDERRWQQNEPSGGDPSAGGDEPSDEI